MNGTDPLLAESGEAPCGPAVEDGVETLQLFPLHPNQAPWHWLVSGELSIEIGPLQGWAGDVD